MGNDILRETNRVHCNNARSRDAGLPGTLTLEEWIAILERFEGMCAYCQSKPFQAMDHLTPHVGGGGTTADNCVPACRRCNSRKGGRMLADDVSSEERVARTREALQRNSLLAAKEVATGPRPCSSRTATSAVMHDEDLKAIETIKARYGISTDSDALRFALRLIAQSDVQLTAKRVAKAATNKS